MGLGILLFSTDNDAIVKNMTHLMSFTIYCIFTNSSLIRLLLFFHRYGFRMITSERQDGSFRNSRQSWVMVKRRGVSFSEPAHPPPQKKTFFLHFRMPRTFFENKNLMNINTFLCGNAQGLQALMSSLF